MDNFQTVIPMLSYENGPEAMNWLCRVFSFKERKRWLDDNGVLMHGEVEMGNGIIMMATPSPHYQAPATHRIKCKETAKWMEVPYVINGVLVYVDDIRKHFEHAKKEGAVILSEIETDGPGKRYRAEDLEGQRWMFMER